LSIFIVQLIVGKDKKKSLTDLCKFKQTMHGWNNNDFNDRIVHEVNTGGGANNESSEICVHLLPVTNLIQPFDQAL